jgi:thermostable 8-oxoguanine DNA glycosylase
MSKKLLTPMQRSAGAVEIVVGDASLRFGWGEIHELGTAAYWVEQTRRSETPGSYRLGDTLAEEVTACILGGHGIPAEVGLAAFACLREEGLLAPGGDRDAIATTLRKPLIVPGRSRPVRYRFVTQRAARVTAALAILDAQPVPREPLALRRFLLTFPGIGPKTASWVVRNWTGSNAVAIIDIHVHRAGLAAGFFSPAWRLPRDYVLFEQAFRAVADIGDVAPAAFDACIWNQMQALGRSRSVFLGSGSDGERRLL